MARRHPRIPFTPVIRNGIRKYCPSVVIGRRDDGPSQIIESFDGKEPKNVNNAQVDRKQCQRVGELTFQTNLTVFVPWRDRSIRPTSYECPMLLVETDIVDSVNDGWVLCCRGRIFSVAFEAEVEAVKWNQISWWDSTQLLIKHHVRRIFLLDVPNNS